MMNRRPHIKTISPRAERCLRVAMVAVNSFMAIGLTIVLCALPMVTGWAQNKNPDPNAPVINVIAEPERPKADESTYLDRVVNSDEYQVGPGDRLAITVIGASPESLELTITPEATLVIPAVGVVDLRNLTLTEARSRLIDLLKEYYPNASPSVSLLEVRRFRITVVGAVENPGLITVTANTRASEAIQTAGLLPPAGKRSIRLLRGNDTLRVDLVVFLNLGNLELNPYVIEGDVLQVPSIDQRWGFVQISGAVVAGGRFELAPGDRIEDLINLAYGLVDPRVRLS